MILSLGIVIIAQVIAYHNIPNSMEPAQFLAHPPKIVEIESNKKLDVLTMAQINSSNLENSGLAQYIFDDDEFVHIPDGTSKVENNNEEPAHNNSNPFVVFGAYQPIDSKYYNSYPGSLTHFHKTIYSIQKNDSYCDVVDLYNLENPDNIFGGMKFITDYPQESTSFPLKEKVAMTCIRLFFRIRGSAALLGDESDRSRCESDNFSLSSEEYWNDSIH